MLYKYMEINKIIEKVKEYNKDANIDLIKKAYEFAVKIHEKHLRASKEQYIVHPLNVAYIVAESKLDEQSVAAALLHDVVEEGNVSIKDLKEKFGEEVALLVDGLTKLTELREKSREKYEAESIRKMLLASTKDIRVILIKLADKLHNMRTLDYLSREDQIRLAQSALDIYTPLAYRLGMDKIKSELQDLALKYLEPGVYHELVEKVNTRFRNREKEIRDVIEILNKRFRESEIKVNITGRPKSIYSIYEKMKKKNIDFENIYDVVGLRIITETIKNCYEILGIIHSLWKPIPGEFNDFIAMPKSNMYQSIHTAVNNHGKIIEIQIRTKEMDEIAQEGIAAHWVYKNIYGDTKFDKKLSWLKEFLEWQKSSEDHKEFMDELKLDFFDREIFCFTPKGKLIELPKHSCIVDFAYVVHSDLGDKCVAGRVNGKFVSLRQEVKNGDIIEVITEKNQRPRNEWLKFVKTANARTKIKKSLREHGEQIITPIKEEEVKKNSILMVKGVKDASIVFSKCCQPLPGDEIKGLLVKNNLVKVHQPGCTGLKDKKKIIDVKWIDPSEKIIGFNIDAYDRMGLFADILNQIVQTKTNVEKAQARIVNENMARCIFSLKIRSMEHLRDLLLRIKNIKDVKNVDVGIV